MSSIGLEQTSFRKHEPEDYAGGDSSENAEEVRSDNGKNDTHAGAVGWDASQHRAHCHNHTSEQLARLETVAIPAHEDEPAADGITHQVHTTLEVGFGVRTEGGVVTYIDNEQLDSLTTDNNIPGEKEALVDGGGFAQRPSRDVRQEANAVEAGAERKALEDENTRCGKVNSLRANSWH